MRARMAPSDEKRRAGGAIRVPFVRRCRLDYGDGQVDSAFIVNINSLGELAGRTEDELLGCKNFGHTSLNEIKQQLGSFGLSLRKLED